MIELAIDTSTETASIAVSQQRRILVELTWQAGQNHSVELLPNLDHALRLAGLAARDIGAIIVARGPGSFNGLRVGVSTAKGLALALGIPMVGIGTLEGEAYQYASRGLPIYALSDAGRGEIAAALYRTRRGKWQQAVAEHITTVEALCRTVERRAVFCGRMNESITSELAQRLGKKALVVEGASALRRAGYLAELGWRRIEAGDFDDPTTLQPIYLRRPHITEAKPLHFPRP